MDINFEAQYHVGKGQELAACDKYQEALDRFDKALSANPDYVDAWLYRGVALMNLNRDHEALESLLHAHTRDPHNGNIRYQIAKVRRRVGLPGYDRTGSTAVDENQTAGEATSQAPPYVPPQLPRKQSSNWFTRWFIQLFRRFRSTVTRQQEDITQVAPPSTHLVRDEKIKPSLHSQQKVAELRKNLMRKTLRNEAIVTRLINFERMRYPDASETELYQYAIERWERDNR